MTSGSSRASERLTSGSASERERAPRRARAAPTSASGPGSETWRLTRVVTPRANAGQFIAEWWRRDQRNIVPSCIIPPMHSDCLVAVGLSRRSCQICWGSGVAMAVAVVVVLLSCATPALVVEETDDNRSCSSSATDKIVPELPPSCHPATQDTACMLGSSAAATLSSGGVHREPHFLPPPLLAALRRDVAELLQEGSFREAARCRKRGLCNEPSESGAPMPVWPASAA